MRKIYLKWTSVLLGTVCLLNLVACQKAISEKQVQESGASLVHETKTLVNQTVKKEEKGLSLSTLLLLKNQENYVFETQEQKYAGEFKMKRLDHSDEKKTEADPWVHIAFQKIALDGENERPTLSSVYPEVAFPVNSGLEVDKAYAHLKYKKNDAGNFKWTYAFVDTVRDEKKYKDLYVEVFIQDDYCYMDSDELLFLHFKFESSDDHPFVFNAKQQEQDLLALLDRLFLDLTINPNAVKNACTL